MGRIFCMSLSGSAIFFLRGLLWSFIIPTLSNANTESIDGRFSFSLSTFDPNGKLGQVERAMIASSLGTPIVAVIKNDRILLASPQILPSPFMKDDGTTRFAPITQHIVMAHSGISADGRVLIAAAQQLAIEHAYTYDENIPIDLFLEEMSLLFQEYTMTPGVRPFGAIVLIAYIPPDGGGMGMGAEKEEERRRPRLFRIDPSGSVTSYDNNNDEDNDGKDNKSVIAMVNANFAKTRSSGLESNLRDFGENTDTTTVEDDLMRISRILEEAISQKERGGAVSNIIFGPKSNEKKKNRGNEDGTSTVQEEDHRPMVVTLPSAIISACLTRDVGLQVHRRPLKEIKGGSRR